MHDRLGRRRPYGHVARRPVHRVEHAHVLERWAGPRWPDHLRGTLEASNTTIAYSEASLLDVLRPGAGRCSGLSGLTLRQQPALAAPSSYPVHRGWCVSARREQRQEILERLGEQKLSIASSRSFCRHRRASAAQAVFRCGTSARSRRSSSLPIARYCGLPVRRVQVRPRGFPTIPAAVDTSVAEFHAAVVVRVGSRRARHTSSPCMTLAAPAQSTSPQAERRAVAGMNASSAAAVARDRALYCAQCSYGLTAASQIRRRALSRRVAIDRGRCCRLHAA